MLVLALESSAKTASVAVYDGNLLGQHISDSGYSHSRTLLVAVETLLTDLKLKLKDIELIAVANGPGSFTGVRIGVSGVKGLAFGLGIPVCGISTLEAMAYQTAAQCQPPVICPVMDARRGQVYNALFETDGSGKPVRICQDRALSVDELAANLVDIGKPFMPVGDGVNLIISALAGHETLQLITPEPAVRLQSAYGVALASAHAKRVPPSELEPVYLRPSQAERERSAR